MNKFRQDCATLAKLLRAAHTYTSQNRYEIKLHRKPLAKAFDGNSPEATTQGKTEMDKEVDGALDRCTSKVVQVASKAGGLAERVAELEEKADAEASEQDLLKREIRKSAQREKQLRSDALQLAKHL